MSPKESVKSDFSLLHCHSAVAVYWISWCSGYPSCFLFNRPLVWLFLWFFSVCPCEFWDSTIKYNLTASSHVPLQCSSHLLLHYFINWFTVWVIKSVTI